MPLRMQPRANADAAHVVVVVDGGDEHLHGRILLALGRGHVLEDGLEQGL